MTLFTIALTLLMTVAPGSRKPAADSVATFSRLGPGDELEVHFRSNAWLNDARFRLVFHGSPLTVTLSRVSQLPGFRERLPTHEITAALADSVVAGLDELLRHYRTRSRGACDTVDHIELRQLRDGVTVGRETFVDRSCRMHTNGDLVALHRLISGICWADAARRHSR